MFCRGSGAGKWEKAITKKGRGVQEWLQKMSLYSAKINSKDHNCLMMLVNTEFCMALTDIPSPEREEEEETEYGLKETRLCINMD